MARTVASLSVSINASLTGLRKGLTRAGKLVGDFKDRVGRLTKSIAGLGAKGALAAAGFVGLGTGLAAKSLDKLAKTANKLDIDPTQLIALRDAAQESGIGVKKLDDGLQRMLRRTQEASKGTGEAKDTLKELGLDAKALVKLAPEQQFLKIAVAMQKAAGDGLSLARTMKLVDSENVGLLNTFELVAKKGLEPFIKNVKRSGRAVTREQLKPIEDVHDALGRMGDRIGGVFSTIAVAAAPTISALLKDLERFLNQPESVLAIRDAFREMADAIRAAGEELRKILKDRDAIMEALAAPTRAVNAANQAGVSTRDFLSRMMTSPVQTIKQEASAFIDRNSMASLFKKLNEIRGAQATGPGSGHIIRGSDGQRTDMGAIKPVLEKIEENTRQPSGSLNKDFPKGSMIIQVNVAG